MLWRETCSENLQVLRETRVNDDEFEEYFMVRRTRVRVATKTKATMVYLEYRTKENRFLHAYASTRKY